MRPRLPRAPPDTSTCTCRTSKVSCAHLVCSPFLPGRISAIGSTGILVQLISGVDVPPFSEGPWASDSGPTGMVQPGRPLRHLSKFRLFVNWREGRVGRDDRRPMRRWR
eukprot:scaffold1137_cov392-Pavlova_lutheri.AAC.2